MTNRTTRRMSALRLGALLAVACGAPKTTQAPSPPTAAEDPCEACLTDGGTWQPEASACTEDCMIQDISCYRDKCPDPCSSEACGSCVTQAACAEASCTWQSSAEAMWCS